MKDKNLTAGQFRFVWNNFLETRAIAALALVVGILIGVGLGVALPKVF